MESKLIIKGVSIGDMFLERGSKNLKAIVVDILECRSLQTNEVVKYICIAEPVDSLATNQFEVPFATVQRYKVNEQNQFINVKY